MQETFRNRRCNKALRWFSQISAQVTAWHTQWWTMRYLSSSRIIIVFYDPQSLLIKEGAQISHCILRWYTTTLIPVNLLHNLIILSKRFGNSFATWIMMKIQLFGTYFVTFCPFSTSIVYMILQSCYIAIGDRNGKNQHTKLCILTCSHSLEDYKSSILLYSQP